MEAYTFVTASQANKRKQTKREVRGSEYVDLSFFKEPRNRFHGIDSASLCSRAYSYSVPIAPLDC
jgi:hypothetical protein